MSSTSRTTSAEPDPPTTHRPTGEPAGGLSAAEAARRLAATGPNTLPHPPRVGTLQRVGHQLRDPMILLLLAAGVLTVLVSDAADAAVIALVVVVNTAVGVTQDLRADRAVAELDAMTAPAAEVVREGRRTTVPAAEVVPGDLVRLDAGGIVPADLRLAEALGLAVDESATTGESVPVDRAAGEELLAGTVVTRGRGHGEVLRTGADSSLGRVADLVGAARARETPLQRRLRALSRDLVIAVLVIGVVVVVLGLVRGEPLVQTSVLAVSLAVAAVPESLPAVVTIALALGARRMAQRQALVRHLPAVETLGSVTTLASDKTGTLTEGRMVAGAAWVPPDRRLEVTGTGYAPYGDLAPAPADDDEQQRRVRLLRDAVLCNDARLVPPAGESGGDGDGALWAAAGDPLEAALLALAAKGGVDAEEERRRWPRVGEVPFEAVRGTMTTWHARASDRLAVCKGAPEPVLDLVGLEPGPRARVEAEVTRLAAAGFRVLAVADAVGAGLRSGREAWELAGLVGIADPPREASRGVVDACRRAGISVLLVTGDHPVTAGAVAEHLGIDRVHARTRPEEKVAVLHELQDGGEVVAMTGDGVNDAPALRMADIGVAMGRGGTEVARQAADLVLADDDLSTVVAAVEEGRRIYGNIRTFLRYALSGGLAEVVVVVLGPLVGLLLPLLPAQILWINMLTHGLPGVAFGTEPGRASAMQRPPRSPRESVLGGGLGRQVLLLGGGIGLVSLAAGAGAQAAGWHVQTTVFLALGSAQLAVAAALRAPGRERRPLDVAVAGAALLQLGGVYLPPLNTLLGTEPLPWSVAVVVVVLAALPGLALRLRRASGHDR